MEYQINQTVLGFPLSLTTNELCFSPKTIDRGTLVMLSLISLTFGQKVLDLGCGYGVVGIACAKVVGSENVVMSDIDTNAVRLAKINSFNNNVSTINVVESNGFSALTETDFDVILCNPPYHTDFSVAKTFIEKGFNRLKIGGRMHMVTKRKEWYKQKFISIFGGVQIYETDGYYVFTAEKRDYHYSKNQNNKKCKNGLLNQQTPL